MDLFGGVRLPGLCYSQMTPLSLRAGNQRLDVGALQEQRPRVAA